MKKVIAVVLCVALVLCSTLFVRAEPVDNLKGEISDYPVVVVPGFASSALYEVSTGESAWNIDFLALVTDIFADIGKAIAAIGGLTVGNTDIIAEMVGENLLKQCEKVICNDDGTSKYSLQVYSTDAAMTNHTALDLYADGAHKYEAECVDEIEKYVSRDEIYYFNCDWRMGAEFCANMLRDYIDSVIAHSGKEKVNIYAISHGGQITATYFALYGEEMKVDNCIMSSPAIGGAAIAYDAFSGDVDLDEENLLRFIEHGMKWEEDYNWLVKAKALGILDDLLNSVAPYFFRAIGNWGCIWDFMPADVYDEAKERLLDKEENARLIEISDRFHYEILPLMNTKLQALVEAGVDISIIAGYGNEAVSGMNCTSDGIITTQGQSGAYCAPFGKRFADGYVQKNPCNGNYKLSPGRDIDASTAYLPDNTWFVENHYHGMIIRAPYTSELFMNLLLTDNLPDVYADPDYPQFHDSLNASCGIWAHFDNCASGYIDSDAKSLVIRNVCNESEIRITAVVCDGLDITFLVDAAHVLAPGESVEIPFVGEIEKVSGKTVDITTYFLMDNLTPTGYRTQKFTVMNGEAVTGSDGFVQAENESMFDSLLAKLGLKEFVTMVINVLRYTLELAFSAVIY